MRASTLPEIAGDSGIFTDGGWVESKDQDPDGEVRLIQLADIGIGDFLDKSSRALTLYKARQLKCTLLEPGDILIARMPDPIGRACIFPGLGRPCATAVDVCVLRVDPHVAYGPYVKWMINSPDFLNDVARHIRGSTRTRISRKNLGLLTVPLPPLEEQKRIAAILDQADALRRLRRRALDRLNTLGQSIFHEMFGDPLTDCIPDQKWTHETLETNIHFIDYRGKTPPKSEEGIPLITAKNVKAGYILREPQEYIDAGAYDEWMTRGIPRKGDVLFTTEAPLGNVAQLDTDEKLVVGQRLITMRPNSQFISPLYLLYYLMSTGFREKMYENSTGSTVVGIKSKLLKKIGIFYPDVDIQEKFAKKIALTSSVSSQAELAADRAEAAFKSLQTAAFEGTL
ncbi:MAG: restriction endonuclease subunit S [Pseudomonadota bacterium]